MEDGALRRRPLSSNHTSKSIIETFIEKVLSEIDNVKT